MQSRSQLNVGIYWFRHDLRLHDNESLMQLCQQVDNLLCIFVVDPRWFKASHYQSTHMGTHRWLFLHTDALFKSRWMHSERALINAEWYYPVSLPIFAPDKKPLTNNTNLRKLFRLLHLFLLPERIFQHPVLLHYVFHLSCWQGCDKAFQVLGCYLTFLYYDAGNPNKDS